MEPKDRDIAMVFQSYALYPHLTVYDNMAFGLKLRKVPKDEIDQKVKEAAKIVAKYGGGYLLGSALLGFPIATSAVVASLISFGIKSANDSKKVLLFAGALVFEKDYINDFVNAE